MTKPRKPRNFKIGKFYFSSNFIPFAFVKKTDSQIAFGFKPKEARRIGEALVKWSDWKDGTNGKVYRRYMVFRTRT